MNKKIGIPGWMIGENSFGVTAPYMNFISYFGEPVILDPKSSEKNDLDLIILPGGPDVDTNRYKEPPEYFTSKPCPFREFFDKTHLLKYINKGVPVFGICRGMQSLSVMAGYKLHQHINHVVNDKYERWNLVHNITIPIKSLNRLKIKIDNNFGVNSIHHQAVIKGEKENFLKLQQIGFSSEEKKERTYVEIVASEKFPIIGVQWHPEEIFDSFSMNTISYLLESKKPIIF